MTPLLVTRDEAARALRTSPERVDRLAESGRLPAVRLFPDDAAMFRPEDLLGLLDDAAGEAVPA